MAPHIPDTGATDQAVLSDLLHVKALFQLRAISAVLGFPAVDADSDPGSWADALIFECPSRTTQDHPSNHETNADRSAQAGMISGFHSRANSIRSEQDND